MSIRTITLDPWNPRRDLVQEAANQLRIGRVLLVPTDTTWALICNAQERSAVAKLTTLRERTDRARGDERELKNRPLALMCPNLSSVGRFTLMDQAQFRMVKRLLPGPYTILLPASREVPRLLRENRKAIGIRLPAFPLVEAILEEFGDPVFTTTARDADGNLLQSPADLHNDLRQAVDLIIETDHIVPMESTVVDATVDPPQVIRAGLGALEDHWESAPKND